MIKKNATDSVHPKYRSDIDGLRAIAVLSVLGFHAFPESIRGRFVGVDVFFVISGYLISTILYNGIKKGNFSFVEFYSRRINRIFPALLCVLFFSCVVGWFVLLYDEYRQLGGHVAAGTGFLSNFVLWKEVNYFDNAAETKPLLHLWSLGIEEQFYIVWPIVLLSILKWPRFVWFFIVGLIAVSFGLNIKGVSLDPAATFYSPQTRFWELMCGGLLAWAFVSRANGQVAGETAKQSSGAWENVLAWIGAALLVLGFSYVNATQEFPGWRALFPVLGAVFLIAAGDKAWFNRHILSWKPLVWVGLISFPLYLWHWPIFTFPRIVLGEVPSITVRVVLIVVAIVLAWMTYHFLEKKVRKNQSNRSALILLVLMIVVGGIGYIIYLKDGFPNRKYAQLQGLNGDIGHHEFHKYMESHFPLCKPEELAKKAEVWDGFVRCQQSKTDAKVDVAVLGDSHAEHLFIGIAESLPQKNVAFYIKGDLPFADSQVIGYLVHFIAENRDISDVVISANWHGRIGLLKPGVDLGDELMKSVELLLQSGKKVNLVMDTPSFPFEPEKCKGSRWIWAKERTCSIAVADYEAQTKIYKSHLQKIVTKYPDIHILEPGAALCSDAVCSMAKDGEILYRDFHHLNIPGSKLVGADLVKKYPFAFQ